MNTYEYNVTSAFVPYLINGDASDLEDWEIKRLEEFEKYVQEEHGAGHWSFDPDIEPKFGYCDVTDTKANCVEMEWVVMKASKAVLNALLRVILERKLEDKQ